MNKFTLTIIGLLVGIGVLIYFASANKKANKVPVDISDLSVVSETDHVLGSRDADVVLFEYSDFECPACRAFHPLTKEITDKYGDQIAFVPRHFPLYFHQNARPAAYAAEAAGKQGKYFEMADLIFATQGDWTGKTANISLFYPYAEQLELDMDQFKADATSDEVKAKVDKDFNLGTALGVNSTPTFAINGERITQNPNTLEGFSELIDAALEVAANTLEQPAEEVDSASTTEEVSTTTEE